MLKLAAPMLLIVMLVSACGTPGTSGAVAVETYLTALIAKDADAVINTSCLNWENGAQADIDAFLTVDAELSNDFACQDISPNQVECSGAILFKYGEEIQELSLEGAIYHVQEEAGEWRMCGYQ